MKKAILIFLAVFSISQLCLSQDVITLRSGEIIRSKILEIGLTDIRYKKFDNQNGPQYVVVKSDVSNIVYENGTKDVFNAEPAKKELVKTAPSSDSILTVSSVTPKPEKKCKKQVPLDFQVYGQREYGLPQLFQIWAPPHSLKGRGILSKVMASGFSFRGIYQSILACFLMSILMIIIFSWLKKGQVNQTAWTVAEGAQHSSQQSTSEMHFDMQATGFRLGGKYIIGNNKIRPWVGADFGYYKWTANYFNADKGKTYGKDEGYVTGMTYLLGLDIEVMSGIVITPFVDFASPVATYKMKDLIYMQWDIENDSHIMGTNRIGVTLSFSPNGTPKK